jgi:Kef-type K+ transport system membrane component KefB
MIFILAEAIPDYEYLEEITAIVFNVVFLITFIYTPILIAIFKKYKSDFDIEYKAEKKLIH